MKNLISISILLTFALTTQVEAKSSSKTEVSKKPQIQVKSQKEQAKVYRHHESNWRQPTYAEHMTLFNCRDSWGHKLRGKFSQEQQYFIELGGGSCRKISRYDNRYGALKAFRHYDIDLSDVYRAIEQVQYTYGLGHARLVEAENISSGHRSFKYTLVFRSPERGYREFRVKHNRWNGEVKAIYEV
ncbi:hypothetical protein [Aliikangiella sp. G2MR2-5]|uniref:hypothetical protein n=1 Tax=Aliikangiella sp. G2MR2-5 TaxID=2788943 RepID=UPI0018AB7AC5|nr:hypothetical protein [Aliikangiella sp. G2MR2-5]